MSPLSYKDACREIGQRYASQNWRTRRHTQGRLVSCPFDRTLPHVPSQGRVLELGCGHGVFCHLMQIHHLQLSIQGMDPSPSKIDSAQKSVSGIPRMGFEQGTFPKEGEADWDAIFFMDVFYLIPPDEKRALFLKCLRLLKPGGILLIKDIDTRPLWKFLLSYAQEILAVHLLRITHGQGLFYEPLRRLGEELPSAASWRVEAIHENYPYSHAQLLIHKK